MKSSSLANGATVVLVACAVVITGLVVRRELFTQPISGVTSLAPTTVRNWRDYATAGTLVGPPNASVTLVEFSDFQCPFCKRLADEIAAARRQYPADIAVRYRHFPLTNAHPYAMVAAIAAECAGLQGHFAAYHDALYAKQDSIGRLPWARLAYDAGIPDTSAFNACVRDSATIGRVRADIAAGSKLGVTGTPVLLVNDRRISGAPAKAVFDSMIADAIARPK